MESSSSDCIMGQLTTELVHGTFSDFGRSETRNNHLMELCQDNHENLCKLPTKCTTRWAEETIVCELIIKKIKSLLDE